MEIRVIPKHTHHKANSIEIIQKSVCVTNFWNDLHKKKNLSNFDLDMTLYVIFPCQAFPMDY